MAIYGSLGEVDLGALDASIADTAVDIFVYDTRKDSDGGQWRKRTQHTSWYNETLNTTTRGSRREFPAVAVIVATTNTITIYDGDDPDMPMWMVFSPGGILDWPTVTHSRQYVEALNGLLVTVSEDGGLIFKFIEDFVEVIYSSANYVITSSRTIAGRNDATSYDISAGNAIRTYVAATYAMNDVAMTVLPNAPIDDATGLPIPTIAVATNGGVSVIKDDGTVVDIIDSNSGYRKNLQVKFTTDNKVVYTESSAASEYGWMYIHEIPSSDETITINTKDTALGWYDTRTQSYMQNILGVTIDASINVDRNAGLSDGIGTTIPNIVTGNNHIFVAPSENSGITLIEENRSTTNSGLVAYATTSYNTGWMHGDIKGAWLSDTSTASVTGTELNQYGDFSSTTGWESRSAAWTISGGVATVSSDAGYQLLGTSSGTLVNGRKYSITVNVTAFTNGRLELSQANSSNIPLTLSSTGFKSFIITYTGTTGYSLGFYGYGDVSYGFTIDNLFVRELLEADRSVNNNGLAVYGTITKSAVA